MKELTNFRQYLNEGQLNEGSTTKFYAFNDDGDIEHGYMLQNITGKSEDEIEKHIKNTLDNFYDEGLGIRCVQEEPWITVAETNEFIIALVMAKNKKLAKKIFTESLRISDEKNIPYMGWQHSENIFWPDERPTWTSAAVLLAADTIFEFTKGFNLFLENQSDLY